MSENAVHHQISNDFQFKINLHFTHCHFDKKFIVIVINPQEKVSVFASFSMIKIRKSF